MPFGSIGSALSGFASDVKQNVSGQLQELGTSLKNIGSIGQGESAVDYTGPLVFPHALRNLDRPLIVMSAFIKEGSGKETKSEWRHVFLPIPPTLSFSDSAQYNEINLGILGAGMQVGQQGGGLNRAAGTVLTQLKSMTGSDILETIAGKTKFADQASLLTRTVANPNTNVTFTGHGVRSFSFNFTMMAKDAEESETIRQIHERFRYYNYADLRRGNNLLLSYPPTWQIRFMAPVAKEENKANPTLSTNGADLKEMKHIPRIFSCYLTNVTTTVNDQGNMYFGKDNAPLSVSVSLTYQETRALNRKDIQDMENDKLNNRGINEDGVPTLSTPVEGDPTILSQEAATFLNRADANLSKATEALRVSADKATEKVKGEK
tara:strand:+ start:787 stop:1917 length:1131 start_codon:yes stop_codon:yes gene_type:complete